MRKSMRPIEQQRAYDDWLFARNAPRKPSWWWRFLAYIGWFR
jgi:hypothetical protein